MRRPGLYRDFPTNWSDEVETPVYDSGLARKFLTLG